MDILDDVKIHNLIVSGATVQLLLIRCLTPSAENLFSAEGGGLNPNGGSTFIDY